MNTYHSHTFSRNLYANVAEMRPIATAPSATLAEDDTLAWKLWALDARTNLAALVDPAQLADFLAEIDSLPIVEQYRRIAAQVKLEEAHRLQSGCTCCEADAMRCPTCCALLDEGDVEF